MNQRKTILIRGCVKSLSGYGNWTRQIIYTILKSKLADQFDINIWPCNWGHTPLTALDESTEVNELFKKIIAKPQLTSQPDVFMTITIPSEFQRIGKFNIGITAACETDRISIEWINKINQETDCVFAISKWTAEMMNNTKYSRKDTPNGPVTNVIKIVKSLNVWSPAVDTKIYNPKVKCKLDLNLTTTKNFLFVGHWLKGDYGKDRKNIGVLVKNFLQTFLGNKDVGLILKTSHAHYSLLDKREILNKIKAIKKTMVHNPDKLEFPKIYLVHGNLKDEEMAQLYNHPSIISYVSLHHGEGWGMPITEAMACDVPAIMIPWSGNVDYLKDGHFIPIHFGLQEIPDDCLWDDIFIKGAQWAVPDENKVQQSFRWVIENPKDARRIGRKGGTLIRENFSLDNMQTETDIILENIYNTIHHRIDKSKIPFKEI